MGRSNILRDVIILPIFMKERDGVSYVCSSSSLREMAVEMSCNAYRHSGENRNP